LREAFILSANERRRHMNKGARAMVAAKIRAGGFLKTTRAAQGGGELFPTLEPGNRKTNCRRPPNG
jgi:hypothetical protein